MAKAKKLPSGNWRVQVYSHTDTDGKRHYESFTASTKKEAELMAAEFSTSHKKTSYEDITFERAGEEYINIKENVLSPSTIRGYRAILRNYTSELNPIKIKHIDNEMVQRCVNKQAAIRSPKTVSNVYGFCSAVLSLYRSDLKLKVSLPQKIKSEIIVPTDEEIKQILYAAKESELYIPICLAAFGSLRRSEICAVIMPDDLTECGVFVRKSMVLGSNGYTIKQSTKTLSSRRIAFLPEFVLSLLHDKKGSVTSYTPNGLSDAFHNLLKKNGIRDMRFHDLRHYWVSCAFAEGMPDHYIMKNGGWSTMSTPRAVYAHIMQDKNEEVSSALNNRFSKMQHEMQHESK